MTVGSGGCSIPNKIGKIATITTETGSQTLPLPDGTNGKITTLSTLESAIYTDPWTKTIISINEKQKAIMLIPPEPSKTLEYHLDFTITTDYNSLIANNLNPGDIYKVDIYISDFFTDSYYYAISYTANFTVDINGNLSVSLPSGTIMDKFGSGTHTLFVDSPDCKVAYYPIV